MMMENRVAYLFIMVIYRMSYSFFFNLKLPSPVTVKVFSAELSSLSRAGGINEVVNVEIVE